MQKSCGDPDYLDPVRADNMGKRKCEYISKT